MRRLIPVLLLMCAVTLSIVLANSTIRIEGAPRPPLRLLQVDPDRGPRADAGIPDATRWPTEAMAREIQKTLDALGALIAGASAIGPKEVADLADAKVSCDPLRPATLETILDEDSITVQRPPDKAATGRAREGTAGLAQELEALRSSLANHGAVGVSLQIVGIEEAGNVVTARVLFHAGAPGAGNTPGTIDSSATWETKWSLSPGASPRLLRIGAADFEEVTGKSSIFRNDTESILGREKVYAAQFVPGVDYWLSRLESWIESDGFGHNGLAVGDVNGDGLDDLYVCDMAGLPNRLFIQQPDGTAKDASAEAGVDWLERSRSALLLDLDNDGDQDLVVATSVSVLFMANDGAGRFKLASSLVVGEDGRLAPPAGPVQPVRSGGASGGGAEEGHFSRAGDLGTARPSNLVMISAADYDNDGDLDIHACSYHSSDEAMQDFPIPIPYHDAQNGGADALLQNQGNLTFVDVTAASGMDAGNNRFSFAASWEDYDDDGDQDLYVANDFGRDNLYRNDKGRFADVAAAAGVDDIGPGMSASWGDYDNDGRFDLYVANIFSPAGTRLAGERDFQPEAAGAVREQYRRHARGNSLFHNKGDGTFEDVSEKTAVTMGRWAWDSKFIDLNNDGWEDLVSVNGYFTRDSIEDLHDYFWTTVVARSPLVSVPRKDVGEYAAAWKSLGRMIREGMSLSGHEPDSVFLNMRGGRFAFAPATAGLDQPDDGRAAAVTDWDGDGDLDLWMMSRTGPRLRFMRNALRHDGHWMAIHLEGRSANRDAIGARVEVKLKDGGRRVRSLYAGSGYLAQSSKWIHFGLGAATQVASLSVRWPDGRIENFGALIADRRYRIRQGEGKAVEMSAPARPAPPGATDDPPAYRPDPDRARIVFSSPGPAPIITYVRLDSTPSRVMSGSPLLVTLWGSDCPECMDQLTAIKDRAGKFAEAGLKVLALNVDGLAGEPADRAAAKRAIEGIQFPFEAGFADADLIRKMDILMRKLMTLSRPLPVPSSIFIDGNDLVAAVYRGPADIDALLADLPSLAVAGPKRLALAVPFAGLRQTRGMPSLFETMDAVARGWTDAGYVDDAIRYYTRVLKIQPRRVQTLVDLGTALAASGRAEEASARYREVLAIEPDHVGAMNNLASLLAGRGATAEAIDLFRGALAKEPTNMFALENLATMLMAGGELKEATALLREALRLQPDNRSVLNNLAVAVARGGNDDEAIALYERLLVLEPGNVPAHINLGIALMRKSRPDDALGHLKEAARLHPDYVEARYHYGVALLRAGKREDAASELSEAARVSPEHRMARYNLSIALALLGRTDEAVARMAEALGASSQMTPAALRLTWALASGADPALRDGARAVELSERACAQARENPDCLDAMAAAYAEAGRFDEAVRAARAALAGAEAKGPKEQTEAIRARLRSYQAGRAWRQSGGAQP